MYVHWEIDSVYHIAKHGVDQAEAEYLVYHARPPYPEELGEGKYAVWGPTADGRFLQVIFVYRPVEAIDLSSVPLHRRFELEKENEVICIIPARNLTTDEKRRLRRRRGRQ